MAESSPELTTKARDEIRRRILSGHYPAGQMLSTAILEDDLAIKRMPIRQALMQLESEDLVEVLPKRGTRVKTLSPQEVIEIMQVRQVLEQFVAAELLTSLSSEDELKPLIQINNEMKRMSLSTHSDSRSIVEFIEQDFKFHCKLAELAGYELTIGKFLRNLKGRFRLIAVSNDMQNAADTVSEHQNIIDALQCSVTNRESCDVVAAIKKHVELATERWKRATGHV